MYSTVLVIEGVVQVATELIDAAPDGAIKKTMEAAQIYYAHRLTDFTRTNLLSEFATSIRSAATDTARLRSARHEHKFDKHSGSKKVSLTQATALYGSPGTTIQNLAGQVIGCWKPATQNIISRLPVDEHQAEINAAYHRIVHVIETLGKLYTLVKKASDEYKRWELGYGAVDAAIFECIVLVAGALDLAERMDNGTVGYDALRRDASGAWNIVEGALELSRSARADMLFSRVWCAGKAGMLNFATDNGGIAPEMAVRLHARGSKPSLY